MLQRHCTRADPASEQHGGVSVAADEQALVLIASVPLSDAAWRPLAEGELIAVRGGEEIHARLAQ
jgi:predicted glutamine amidotransferase